ncbi:restriction endonuclease, partial [Candidatus Babeliales bacterium]|nr:restriction endonuclease [Candidatus Babeliales bacterium]
QIGFLGLLLQSYASRSPSDMRMVDKINKMKSRESNLYELNPKEFEELCAEILKAQGFDRVEFYGRPGEKQQGIDIIGESGDQKIAVQVKHTRQLSLSNVKNIIAQVQASSFQPKQLIIMTSATLSPSLISSIQELPSDIEVNLIGQDEILQSLNDYPKIRQAKLEPAQRRTIRQRWELHIGVTGAAFSILGLLISGISFFVQPEKPLLQERIETVERAIGNLKDLEKQLTEIKGDMVETEKAAKAIEQEYVKAKELEKLTDEQFEAVKTALRSQSWQKTAFNYVLGFVLGVAASLISNVIYSRIRQHRAIRHTE